MLNEFLNHKQIVQVTSIGLGLATFLFAFGLLRIIFRERIKSAREWEFEEAQWVRLRKDSALIRWFEPLVTELRGLVPKMTDDQREEHLRRLAAAGESPGWDPPELYIAAGLFQGILVGLFAALAGYLLVDETVAAFLFLLGFWGYPKLLLKQVKDRAARRIGSFKTRLPYAMDLMAFMMEAGAGFYEALRTVVAENKEHVLGDEFAHVMHEVAMGRSRETALNHLAKRLRDDDIDELVFAVNKGEEMGTPLSQILRIQADQIRLKRSQWMEKAAGEAQVMIVFPGMLIMLACLAIVMAPFLLPAIE